MGIGSSITATQKDNINNMSITSIATFTTTSGTFVDVTGATKTLVTGANRCLIIYGLQTSNSGASSENYFAIDMDGSDIDLATARVVTANQRDNITRVFLTNTLTAGSHTFKLQMRVSGTTGSVTDDAYGNSFLAVIELID